MTTQNIRMEAQPCSSWNVQGTPPPPRLNQFVLSSSTVGSTIISSTSCPTRARPHAYCPCTIMYPEWPPFLLALRDQITVVCSAAMLYPYTCPPLSQCARRPAGQPSVPPLARPSYPTRRQLVIPPGHGPVAAAAERSGGIARRSPI